MRSTNAKNNTHNDFQPLFPELHVYSLASMYADCRVNKVRNNTSFLKVDIHYTGQLFNVSVHKSDCLNKLLSFTIYWSTMITHDCHKIVHNGKFLLTF